MEGFVAKAGVKESVSEDVTGDEFSDDPLDTLLTAFDGGDADHNYTARVYRINGSAKDGLTQPYLFSLSPEEVSGVQDKLRDDYGSGRYLIRIYNAGRYFRQISYQIESTPKAVSAPVTAPNSVTEIMSGVREMMNEFREEIRRTIVPPAPSVDPVAMFTQAMTTVSTLMGNMRQPAPQPIAPAPSPDAMLSLVTQGIELGKTMAGGGAVDDNGVMGIIKAMFQQPGVGEAVVHMIGSRLTPTAPPGSQLPPPVHRGDAPPPRPQMVAPHNPQPQGTPDQVALTQTLNQLVEASKTSKNIALHVDWFLERTPSHVVTQLMGMPNLLEQLVAVHPGVAANKDWFGAFIDDMRAAVQPETETAPADNNGIARHANAVDGDAGRTGGDAGDSQAHARSNAAG